MIKEKKAKKNQDSLVKEKVRGLQGFGTLAARGATSSSP
jgi:hypothetical protein